LKELSLPSYSFKITGEPGREMIFDSLRRKYVRLTPEEWVRQNFIQYLIHEGNYPPGLIGVEMAINVNRMKRRVDIMVHDRQGRPVMVVECKSPDITLDEKVSDQVVAYNRQLNVPYIIITNGIVHYACKIGIEPNENQYLMVIPQYDELIN
jgi:hypothetical protein